MEVWTGFGKKIHKIPVSRTWELFTRMCIEKAMIQQTREHCSFKRFICSSGYSFAMLKKIEKS